MFESDSRLPRASFLAAGCSPLLAFGCVGSASSVPASGSPGSAPVPWSQLVRRPDRIHLAADCPLSSQVVLAAGKSIGPGPLYPMISHRGILPVVPIADAILADIAPPGTYIQKVLWMAPPTLKSEALVRGHGEAVQSAVLFSLDNATVTRNLRLDPATGGVNPGGWLGWPGYTIVPEPGCYAYQIDGTGFSKIIVFRAVHATEG
jgi:hypothetical protein